MKRRDWLLLIVLLSAIGLAISLYDVAHPWGEQESFCDLTSMLSCSTVNASPWATLFGMRISALGVIGYLLLLAGAVHALVIGPDPLVRRLMSLAAAAASLFSLYLTGIEALVLRVFCPTCLLSQASVLLILLCCWFLHTPEEREGLLKRALTLSGSAAVLGLVIGVPLATHLAYALSFLPHRGSADRLSPAALAGLAQCLTDSGVVMYGSMHCPHCESQKRAFGPAWKNVTYVECGVEGQPRLQLEACREAGITHYPTWEFADGTRLIGETPFSILAAGSGCPLPS